jgi:hypothetical protein
MRWRNLEPHLRIEVFARAWSANTRPTVADRRISPLLPDAVGRADFPDFTVPPLLVGPFPAGHGLAHLRLAVTFALHVTAAYADRFPR